MAESGYLRKTASFGYVQLEWEVVEQFATGNYSTLNYKLYIQRNTGEFTSSAARKYEIWFEGNATISGTVSLLGSGTKTIKQGTVYIDHEPTGNKSFDYAFSLETGLSYGTMTVSGTGDLPKIDRLSTVLPSTSNMYLGVEQLITVRKKVATMKHAIVFHCGDFTYPVTDGIIFDTECLFVPNLDCAYTNTTGTTINGFYEITTYDGATAIGSTKVEVAYSIPASVKPSVDILLTDAPGYFDKYGVFLNGQSQFEVEIKSTLAYNSEIVTYRGEANGGVYKTESFTTDAIKSSGINKILASVTDQRGRTGNCEVSVDVYAYHKPIIHKLAVKRCNADGSNNDNGSYCQVTFSGEVCSINNQNSAKYILRYKQSGNSSYTDLDLTQFNDVYITGEQSIIFSAYDGSTYDIEFKVEDDLFTGAKAETRTTSLSTAFSILHFGAKGKGIGIGKLDEEANPLGLLNNQNPGLMDVGFIARFNEDVCGMVVGLGALPPIPNNSDLNDYVSIGCWQCNGTMSNMPIETIGRLEVYSAYGQRIQETGSARLTQRFTPHSKNYPIYEREVTRSTSGVYTFSEWVGITLSREASLKIYGGNKILWSGCEQVLSGDYLNLSEEVTTQPNGIVLTFSRVYASGNSANEFVNFFIPKSLVDDFNAYAHTFTMSTHDFGAFATKKLWISKTSISGTASNEATGTGACGITYNNSSFALVRVTGI